MSVRRARLPWCAAFVVTALAACNSFRFEPPRTAYAMSERERPTFPAFHVLRRGSGFFRNLAYTLRYGETMQMLPVNTYHLRFAYTPQKIAGYTEWPLGLGFGRALTDSLGNRREVFGIIHEDSAARIQYNFGYLYIWTRPVFSATSAVTLGGGYVVLLMGRWDWSYVPLPLILPIASLTIARFSIESTFVPGWIGYGNVVFTWVQFRL
jgi:hypothetical protein